MDLNKLWTNCKLNNVTRMTLFWPWVLHWQICDWFVSVALTEAMLFFAIDGKNWKIKLIQTSKFLIYFFVVLTSCKTWRSIFIKFMPIESMKEKLMVGLKFPKYQNSFTEWKYNGKRRDAFTTLSNTYDGAYLRKRLQPKSCYLLLQKAPS